ncbi:hypothetical protein BHE74_00044446 [Ensete ventricosum]|nr:hypothetical protein BHE74_00044446 [Ensete ventricosum]RZR98683.1 hypothetical protein BHM03_00028097 [Ensete ventricosum]
MVTMAQATAPFRRTLVLAAAHVDSLVDGGHPCKRPGLPYKGLSHGSSPLARKQLAYGHYQKGWSAEKMREGGELEGVAKEDR